MGYWPSVRSRLLDIGQVLFLRVYGPRRRGGFSLLYLLLWSVETVECSSSHEWIKFNSIWSISLMFSRVRTLYPAVQPFHGLVRLIFTSIVKQRKNTDAKLDNFIACVPPKLNRMAAGYVLEMILIEFNLEQKSRNRNDQFPK